MPFDPQPVLRGRALIARPLRADDFDALYEVARDPERSISGGISSTAPLPRRALR